ncbi:methyltransferase domain-containing protein [Paenibacillus camelliae]|uniref:methyltransferase domain-containing protein n=1 Tax=Paenibacillus camelliae TaxID=512410 RepID=UPI00203C1AAB|nr:methyltransferase domain-containing protein [Paenibacillus camelliae]MCM3635107.1 class I SAM-dependent methyltransferase [Paenibacillus camelliae]
MNNETLYDQQGVAMTCRSFKEYCRMFLLEDELPRHGKVLDVASGASSFTAELCERGYEAYACDPLYKLTPNAMQKHGLAEHELASAKLSAKQHAFVWKDYASLQEHDELRQASLQQFIAHYRNNSAHSRYVVGALPKLPFPDHTFELVCCNHFLFLYQEQFDENFHLEALLEMLRVTKQGGRIVVYPLVGFRNEIYPKLPLLIERLQEQHAEVRLRSTTFRFLPAADRFLEIIKR